jgi:HAD superfamily hydrolase (TIGR01490 family)
MTISKPSVQARPKITLFDLDHTLLPLDSDYAWGLFTTQLGWTDANEFGRRNEGFYAQYQQGVLDIHEYVRFSTQAIRLKGFEASMKARQAYMDEVIVPAIFPQAIKLVKEYQAQSSHVLIITATNEFITRPISNVFGVDELIAIELEHESDQSGLTGWISGEIQGVPSFREGKVLRFEQWLERRHLLIHDVEITFFTDSMNDLPLLELADHPVATNPDPRLRALAEERGWRILDLF